MGWWQKVKDYMVWAVSKPENPEDYETVRARNKKGRYVADDPDTKENEAYVKRKKKKKK
jgi:hypothetical protein